MCLHDKVFQALYFIYSFSLSNRYATEYVTLQKLNKGRVAKTSNSVSSATKTL